MAWPHLPPTGEGTVCTTTVRVKIDFQVPGLSHTLESDVHMTKMKSFENVSWYEGDRRQREERREGGIHPEDDDLILL